MNLVVRLREWAHRSLLEEEERPDSFMERFRGPELRLAPSRVSNTQPDASGSSAKGFLRCPRRMSLCTSNDKTVSVFGDKLSIVLKKD